MKCKIPVGQEANSISSVNSVSLIDSNRFKSIRLLHRFHVYEIHTHCFNGRLLEDVAESRLLHQGVRWREEQEIADRSNRPSLVLTAQALTGDEESKVLHGLALLLSFSNVQADGPRAPVAHVALAVAHTFRAKERFDADQFVVHRDLRISCRFEALNRRLQLLQALPQSAELAAPGRQQLRMGLSDGLVELLAELRQGDLQAC